MSYPFQVEASLDNSTYIPTHCKQSNSLFPQCLKEIEYAPKELYLIGNQETLNAPRVAIVGTRTPTAYGDRITRQLATTLARAGACIISGMARGIDSEAHNSALNVNGKTVAVLGAGIDEIYPKTNHRLYHKIAQAGLIISEFPAGTKPFKGCFPRRNRIIAGLADVTIVIEAAPQSGALITARYALDNNRTVAAIPGPIDSPTSHGPNHLIRDGAQVIATVEDALMLLNLNPPRKQPHAATPLEAQILTALSRKPFTTDTLIQHLKTPTPQVLSALTTLEIRGTIQFLLSGEIILT